VAAVRFPAKVLAAVLLLCLTAGCGPKKTLTAEQYFASASNEFHDGAYKIAVERYRELLDQYPFSEYSEEAELKIAHAHYLNHSCPEAIASFTDFQRRHPTSPYLPFVQFLLGQCYEQQMQPPDRDQSSSQNAHAYYLALTQQYPDSPFADVARARLERCRESMAKHEMVVSSFYRERGNLQAAEYRLLDLVNRFEETDVAGNALYELGSLYRERGEQDRALLAFASVTRHHPDNEVARQAEQALSEMSGAEGEADLLKGDPLVALQARTGRSRPLALNQVVEPPAPSGQHAPGFGPAIGGLPGSSGPFGRPY
jgi:outer membrane protein assembly factor BamD